MKRDVYQKFQLNNGKEVRVGDIISKITKMKDSFGAGTTVETILVTEENLSELLERGIITPVKSVWNDYQNRMTLPYYIEKLAERFGWKPEKMTNYLNTIDSVYPAAAFSMILREVAIELDKKYEDHIEKSPEIYVISMLDGRITKANKAHIKNYRNFAAFRSVEDAKFACSVTREILKELFKSGK